MCTTQSMIKAVQSKYPELYNSVRDLVVFDIRVQRLFDDTYGVNTYENIYNTQLYYNEIQKVKENETSNVWSKVAQKRKVLMDKYLETTSKLACDLGELSLVIVSLLEEHFKKQQVNSI